MYLRTGRGASIFIEISFSLANAFFSSATALLESLCSGNPQLETALSMLLQLSAQTQTSVCLTTFLSPHIINKSIPGMEFGRYDSDGSALELVITEH